MDIFLDIHTTLLDLGNKHFSYCRLSLIKENHTVVILISIYDQKYEYCELSNMNIPIYNTSMGLTYKCSNLKETQEVVSLYLYSGYRLNSIVFRQNYTWVYRPEALSKAYYMEADSYYPTKLTVKDKSDNILFMVPALVGFELSIRHTIDIVYKIVL